jgi:ferredoxin
MTCPKDFACVKNGYANILESKCFAGKFFTCTGSNSYLCQYLLPFGYSFFCTCPLFVHISQKYLASGKVFARNSLQQASSRHLSLL